MKKIKHYLWQLIILAILATIGVVVFLFIENRIYQNFNSDMEWVSSVSLTAINPDRIKRISTLLPGDITSNDDFNFVKDQILSFGKLFENKGIDSIYVLSQKDNQVYFITESTPKGQPLYVLPGKLYEKPPLEALDVFSKNLPLSTAKYSDEYGTYISRFSPMVNSQGEQVGVLGVDVDYSYYQQQVDQAKIIFIIIWFLVYAFVMLCFYYFRNLYRIRSESLKNEKKIMAISNAINDGLVVIDSDSQIVFWNKTSETIFGFSFQDVLGAKFSDLIKINKLINLKTGEAIPKLNLVFDNRFIDSVLELNLLDAKKTKKYYELSFTIADIDDDQYLVCVFHDISKHKEEQVTLEQQKNELGQLNSLMIGRELKMIELKKSISDLKSKKK